MAQYTLQSPVSAAWINAISSTGQAVGCSTQATGDGSECLPTWWPAPYLTNAVDTAFGSMFSQFLTVNSHGYAAGFFGGGDAIAYKLGSDGDPDIPIFAPTPVSVGAADINDMDQLLMEDGTAYQLQAAGSPPVYTATPLTGNPPAGTTCRGMNIVGDIVGDYNGQAFFFSEGQMSIVPGNLSLFDINDNKLAVGYTTGLGPVLPAYVDLSVSKLEWRVNSIPLAPASAPPMTGPVPGQIAVNNAGKIVGNVNNYPFVY